jgi:uncharacterized protein (DUF849 family)
MTRPVWIEAALNGPWGRALQPAIPDTVELIVAEGIACARAGACIIHVHAYDGSGPQTFDWRVYAAIIEGIRSHVDVPVYPSIPTTGTGFGPDTMEVEARFAHIEELARRGLLEFAVIDPGSVNFVDLREIPNGAPGGTYTNPDAHIRHALTFASAHGFHPAFAIYEPGFTRAGAALARAFAGVPVPVYRFMFSETFAWGFSPRPQHLDAHLAQLAECHDGAPWMVAGLGVDITPLVGPAVARGGHVRVGLEDAPFGTESGNVAWVEHAVRLVRAAGAEPATAPEMRAALAAGKAGA